MRSGKLAVSGGHTIYYEEHGSGIPIVVLHGGPGGGMQHSVLKLFSLKEWRVILFDQRGCGKSTPALETRQNTTWHLVSDMEALRLHLGISRWALFGGSWGTTLALAYASRHGSRVTGAILRGVCLMEPWEQRWLYTEEGAARLRPIEWRAFRLGRRTSMVHAYRSRLQNRRTRRAAARAWWDWEAALSTLEPSRDTTPIAKVESLAVLENHYFSHNAWIRPGLLLRAATKMQFPVFIVQGAYDLVCPPMAAVSLARALPNASLKLVHAGHAATEPEIVKGLRTAVLELKARL
jgi:proline iminopeptidase